MREQTGREGEEREYSQCTVIHALNDNYCVYMLTQSRTCLMASKVGVDCTCLSRGVVGIAVNSEHTTLYGIKIHDPFV